MESIKISTAEKIMAAANKFGKINKINIDGVNMTTAFKIMHGSVENALMYHNATRDAFFDSVKSVAISRVNGIVTLSVATEAAK